MSLRPAAKHCRVTLQYAWCPCCILLRLLTLQPQFCLVAIMLLSKCIVPVHSVSLYFSAAANTVLHCVVSCKTKSSKLINCVHFQDVEEHYTAALARLLVPATLRLTRTTLTVSGPLLHPRDGLSQWTLISSASMTQGIAVTTIWSFTMGQMPAIPPLGRTVGWYVFPTVCDPVTG